MSLLAHSMLVALLTLLPLMRLLNFLQLFRKCLFPRCQLLQLAFNLLLHLAQLCNVRLLALSNSMMKTGNIPVALTNALAKIGDFLNTLNKLLFNRPGPA